MVHAMVLYSENLSDLTYVEVSTTLLEIRTLFAIEYNNEMNHEISMYLYTKLLIMELNLGIYVIIQEINSTCNNGVNSLLIRYLLLKKGWNQKLLC